MDYVADDTIFISYVFKSNLLEFNKVNRSECGKGTVLKQDIVEVIGDKSFIPTSGYCLIKCLKCSTGKDYKQKLLDFIRDKKRRSNVTTSLKLNPFV